MHNQHVNAILQFTFLNLSNFHKFLYSHQIAIAENSLAAMGIYWCWFSALIAQIEGGWTKFFFLLLSHGYAFICSTIQNLISSLYYFSA